VLHLLVHEPQWAAVLISVSQPSVATPLQSAWVASHVTTEQTPLLQCSVAPPFVLHAEVQPPQWVASVLRLISHPFDALWSQSSKPMLHAVTEHAYPLLVLLQASVTWFVLHAFPQAPQLLVVVIGVSQPLATLPSQSAKPGLHAILQVEPTHVPTPPFWLHAFPQAPQLLGSLVTLISQPFAACPSQSLNPALHAMTAHFEALHVSVALFVLHGVVQLPQWFGSLVMLISHPLAGLWSQSIVPATVQVDTVHTPRVQTSLAPVTLQAWVHEAQLFGSYRVSISQPSEASLSQSAKPVVHAVIAHVDAAHDSTVLAVLQGVAHEPQWAGSVVRLRHATPGPPSGGQSVGTRVSVHDMPQLVPLHVDTPPTGIGQTLHDVVPHELVDVLSKQVAAAPAPQACVPAGQTQFPPWQTVPPPHVLPHVPQLF
jgi:hypothetical protein